MTKYLILITSLLLNYSAYPMFLQKIPKSNVVRLLSNAHRANPVRAVASNLLNQNLNHRLAISQVKFNNLHSYNKNYSLKLEKENISFPQVLKNEIKNIQKLSYDKKLLKKYLIQKIDFLRKKPEVQEFLNDKEIMKEISYQFKEELENYNKKQVIENDFFMGALIYYHGSYITTLITYNICKSIKIKMGAKDHDAKFFADEVAAYVVVVSALVSMKFTEDYGLWD